LALVLAAGPAAAEAPRLPTDPGLARLIEESLAARPELAQALATAKAERERVPQVGAWPEPMLQLGVQNDGFTSWEVGKMETSFYSIMASQTFPWPGKLRLRSEVAELGAAQADQDVARARLSVEADVRRAWLGLVVARDRLALLERLEAVWQKSAAVARTRYEAGEGAQSDLLRAQLELNRIAQRRWALEGEAASRRQELNRLRGHPLDEPIEPETHVVDLGLPALREAAGVLQDALERSPELAAARLGLTQAERSTALAHRSYFPDVTLGLAVMPRGGDFPPMWQVTLGAPIPVFAGSRQGPAVAESEARAASRLKNAEAVEQVLRLRVRQRQTALAIALETLRLFRDGLLLQSEATVESTLAQYEVGKVTFASVLEANAGFLADQESHLLASAQAHQLEIEAAEVSLAAVGAPGQAMGTSAMPGAAPAGAGAPSGM
jgi:outer membrane protein TolC